eukprot:TRINITY_DN1195_c0_g4_i1.p1 TRINITY_DN1195_c0_g4~~TRINITY_DN1195_c0_g4_i1.p1  ORF type:complete len:451 (+),score=45.83 TRINITY_DN1195_c0_g4_i1:165-1517(+)
MAAATRIALAPQAVSLKSNERFSKSVIAGRSTSSVECSVGGLHRQSWQQEWSRGSLLNVTLDVGRRKLVTRLGRLGSAKVVSNGSRPGQAAAVFDLASIDKQKMEELPSKRRVFDFGDWQKHKSTSRYIRHVLTMPDSRVIQALVPPVLFMTGIASFVVGWNQLVLLSDLPSWAPLLHMSVLPFSLTVPALSFLLVFRTNSCYGRFDEVRKMWGLMLNRSRDITRQALSYMARGDYLHEKPKRDQFLRHMQAFAITYKHHFLQEGNLEEELKKETSLTDDEVKAIIASKHRPNYMLQMMSECMRSCTMDSIQRFSMDTNLTTFADDIGGCERIFKTPIPLSYTRLTSRFLVLWHIFLPFGLYDACGWLTIPATFFSAFVLFCVDEVGVLIEEPFTVLALNAIATSSRTNIAELVSLHGGIQNLVVDDDGRPPPVPTRSSTAVRQGQVILK